MLRHLRLAGGGYLRAKARRQADQALNAALDCRASQQQTLSRILGLNESARLSQSRGLRREMTVAQFRDAVGITTYGDYADAIEELKNGDSSALLGPKNRLLMFAMSSGTTGESKYVPITEPFLKDYRRGWQAWGIRTLDARRKSHLGHFYQAASDFDKFRTPAGIPCGNISGLVSSIQSPVVQTMYSIPQATMKIRDAEAKAYTAAKAGLADPHVAIALTANPSTLVEFSKLIAARADDFVRDLHDGSNVMQSAIGSETWSRWGSSFSRRRRRRAKALSKLVERHGTLRPADFWPMLQTVAVWTGGSCSAYLPALRQAFGDVVIRDHGLSASEGRMTIPFDDETPSGVLDVQSHFFEFVPIDEIDSSDPTVLEAHELNEGEDYFILLTTPSGFVRYDIHDVVRCTGFVGTTPMLEFRHKGSYIASVTGEKVTEKQIVEAVRQALESNGVSSTSYFTAAPEWGDPPRYRFLFEESERDCFHQAAIGDIDAAIRHLNCEYDEKRGTGRLDPLEGLPLPEGTWAKFASSRQQGLGGSAEQYKHPCLLPTLDHLDRFKTDFLS